MLERVEVGGADVGDLGVRLVHRHSVDGRVRIFDSREGHGLDVEGGQQDLLVGQDGLQSGRRLGRQDHAHPAHVDLDWKWQNQTIN